MRDYLWAVETKIAKGEWVAFGQDTRPTRARARRLQKWMRECGQDETRVVKYVRDPWSMRHPRFF